MARWMVEKSTGRRLKVLTRKEAADLFGVHEITVSRWMTSGLPYWKLGHFVWIPLVRGRNWVAEHHPAEDSNEYYLS